MKVADALRSKDRHVSCHSVWTVLTAAYNMGPEGARKVLAEAKVHDPYRPLKELTDRKKEAIINALPRRAQ